MPTLRHRVSGIAQRAGGDDGLKNGLMVSEWLVLAVRWEGAVGSRFGYPVLAL